MMQNVIRAIGNIETYGIISVCLFFGVFLVALAFACAQKKSFCQTMSALPLADDAVPNRPQPPYEK